MDLKLIFVDLEFSHRFMLIDCITENTDKIMQELINISI